MAHNLPINVQHIDRRELYTSLPARVRYLHSFLDFNADDAAALEAGGKYIKALIPAVVNIVYKKLLTYDITARAFTTRSTSYEGPVDEQPHEDSPQIKYRKLFLRGYLQRLCTDPTKMEFWEYMDKVGMMHVGQGRKHPLHVEYIHMGVLLGFVQDIMIEAILNHPRLKMEQKIAVIKALGKVLWIQNDLFAKWYVRDGDEFFTDKDGSEEDLEPEGVLHGQVIVPNLDGDDVVIVDEDGHSDPDALHDHTPTKSPAGGKIPRPSTKRDSDGAAAGAGGCPFSGMMAPDTPSPHAEVKAK
ncbi:Protoglobin-domain-containing protein [Peziza echinospora]|nr:Protoglobin-domain-containing protein [Peziza echinospora]